MVTIEFGEWFSNTDDGFAGVSELENENNGLHRAQVVLSDPYDFRHD